MLKGLYTYAKNILTFFTIPIIAFLAAGLEAAIAVRG